MRPQISDQEKYFLLYAAIDSRKEKWQPVMTKGATARSFSGHFIRISETMDRDWSAEIEMPTTPPLLPCPFCGSCGVSYDASITVVWCQNCDSKGPTENPIAGWNGAKR